MNYLEKGELSAHIQQAKQSGIIHIELSDMLTNIFQGIASKYCYNQSIREDVVSSIWIHFLEQNTIQKLEPNGNPFNYITQQARNHLINYSKRETNRVKRIAELIGKVRELAKTYQCD